MAALDILEDARMVVRDHLGGLQCLRKLDRQLTDYLDLVVDLMGGSFINMAVMAEGEWVVVVVGGVGGGMGEV